MAEIELDVKPFPTRAREPDVERPIDKPHGDRFQSASMTRQLLLSGLLCVEEIKQCLRRIFSVQDLLCLRGLLGGDCASR